MFYLGPVICGFLIGFIFGTRIVNNPKSEIQFTTGSYILILLAALYMAWNLGAFPYYEDIPMAVGIVVGIIGIISGNMVNKLMN